MNKIKKSLTTSFLTGVSDGIVVPLALATGLSRVISDSSYIASIGLLIVLFIAFLMSVSGYYTLKKERESPEETVSRLYANLDLPEGLQKAALEDYRQEKREWNDMIQEAAAGSPAPTVGAAIVGFSFLCAGVLIFLPYLLQDSSLLALRFALIIAVVLLITSGIIKARYTRRPVLAAIIRSVLTGLITAGSAYLLAGIWL